VGVGPGFGSGFGGFGGLGATTAVDAAKKSVPMNNKHTKIVNIFVRFIQGDPLLNSFYLCSQLEKT
jgi:hypothetical protein